MDETYASGNVQGKGHGYKGDKAVFVDTMQRGGNICLQVVRGTDRETLHGFILKKTVSVTEAIYTDEGPAYKSIADKDLSSHANRREEYACMGEKGAV